MNGVHDMGGMQCYGPVVVDTDESPFHQDWESRIFALTLAAGGCRQWSLDAMRFAREQVDPVTYLSGGYYRIWLESLASKLVDAGMVTPQELKVGKAMTPPLLAGRLMAADVPAGLAKGSPTTRAATGPARFAVGDRVHTRNSQPAGHTRMPRYCRDKPGTIAAVHGVHVFPDTHALRAGEQPTWLYSVRFEAEALWGADSTASAVFVDLWEPYLERIAP